MMVTACKTIAVSMLVFILSAPAACADSVPAVTPGQKAYFEMLYREAWNYFQGNLESTTGLPYDSTRRQPITSISNVGFYLAVLAAASETELVSHEEAFQKAETVLAGLEHMEKWRGFPRPWFLVRSLKPAHGASFSYGSHLSVLIGSLVIAKAAFPELEERINAYLGAMQFRDLYDVKSGWLRGGYSMATNNFEIFQPWGHWYYKYFAGETHLLSFYGIGRKAFPAAHWDALIRPVYEWEGERFLATNFEESGLDIQYLAGLFLDERTTEMGKSQKSYALYQMKHAQKIGALVWGWASCENPRGWYQSYGEVRDEIVAPHASVLAAVYFPEEAYINLRTLESLGARPKPLDENPAFGFRDSINWKTGEIARNHMSASEGMTFLALANLLHDGIVWRMFQKDPSVERAHQIFSPKPLVNVDAAGGPSGIETLPVR